MLKRPKRLENHGFYSMSVKTANTLGKRRRETTQNIQPLTDTASCVLGAVHSKKTKVDGSWQSLVQTFQVSDGVDTLRRLLTDLERAVDKINKPVYTTDDKQSLYDDLANTLMGYHELEEKSGLTSNMKIILTSIELQSTAGTEKLRELFSKMGDVLMAQANGTSDASPLDIHQEVEGIKIEADDVQTRYAFEKGPLRERLAPEYDLADVTGDLPEHMDKIWQEQKNLSSIHTLIRKSSLVSSFLTSLQADACDKNMQALLEILTEVRSLLATFAVPEKDAGFLQQVAAATNVCESGKTMYTNTINSWNCPCGPGICRPPVHHWNIPP